MITYVFPEGLRLLGQEERPNSLALRLRGWSLGLPRIPVEHIVSCVPRAKKRVLRLREILRVISTRGAHGFLFLGGGSRGCTAKQTLAINRMESTIEKPKTRNKKEAYSPLWTGTGFFEESPRRFQRPTGLLFFVTGGGGQKAKGEALITVLGSMEGDKLEPATCSEEEDSTLSSARDRFREVATSSAVPSSTSRWTFSASSSSFSSTLEVAVATVGSSSRSTSTARCPEGDSGHGG